MTADAASMVDTALAPGCGEGQVVFLTSPVAIRGVYTHFYYETFEPPRGCMPAVFQVLARVVRQDVSVRARWEGPSRIVVEIDRYKGNLVLSADLRRFDLRVAPGAAMHVSTAIGDVRIEPRDDTSVLTLTLAGSLEPERLRFFYYSEGVVRPLR
jgi:hypothetical protein